MTAPLLWHFPISHFNEKVRWALDWKGVPHVRRVLSADYAPRALWATGQMKLPILFLDGRALYDSTRIIAALEERYPEPPLYPRDDDERRRALALEEFFDEEVGHAVRAALLGPVFARDPAAAIAMLSTGMSPPAARVMRSAGRLLRAYYRARHDISDAAVVTGRQKIMAGLDRVQAELGPSGYLVGDRFSVADLTAAAILAILKPPPELEYLPPDPLPPEVVEYRASIADHPTFRWVAEMYRRHRGRSAEVAA
jgi:glutathione S-transferase